MKDFYFKHIREDVINSFLINKKGSIHDLLVKCNEVTRDIDPDKEIGLRALQKHLKELKEKHGYRIIAYRPTDDEIIAKGYSSNIVSYPHGEVDVRKVKFLKYENDFTPTNFLRADELSKVNEAFVILRRFVGQPGMEWLDEFIDNEDQIINLTPFLESKIQFEENLARVKKPFMKLKDALINEEPLHIRRRIRSKEGLHILVFHPHFMKIWNHKWYVFGEAYEETKQKEYKKQPYVLPIDEDILEIKSVRGVTFQKTTINYTGEPFETSFFKDVIGVTNDLNKKPRRVLIRFHAKDKFNRLNIKPPHFTWNVINESQDYVDVEMRVKINSELRNLIYTYSPGIEIISPDSLRLSIKKDLSKAIERYTN